MAYSIEVNMNKKRSKMISAVWVILLLLFGTVSAFSAQAVTVTAEDAVLTQSSETTIPIYIENNSGLMGFKITVEYPADKIKITSVSKGEVTGKGNFNTNFGINDGRFDVLWNHVEEIQDNGILFLITAKAVSETAENAEITLTYSQRDTFNEQYANVVLDCKNIQVGFSVNSPEPDNEITSSVAENGSQDLIAYDNNDVLSVIQEMLGEYGYETLSEVVSDVQAAFLNTVNEKLSSISGGQYAPVDSFENLVSLYNGAYEGFYISDVTGKISGENIQQAISDALNSTGVSSIEELQDDQKQKFLKEMENNLKKYNSEIAQFSSEIETDKAIDIAQKLDDATKSNSLPAENDENTGPNHMWMIVLGVAVVVAIGTAVILIIKRRKRKHIKPMA